MYTCFSRQRYGPATCSAERLPADQLEEAILDALIETFSTTDLFDEASAQAARRCGSMRDQRMAELKAVEAELSKIEAVIAVPVGL